METNFKNLETLRECSHKYVYRTNKVGEIKKTLSLHSDILSAFKASNELDVKKFIEEYLIEEDFSCKRAYETEVQKKTALYERFFDYLRAKLVKPVIDVPFSFDIDLKDIERIYGRVDFLIKNETGYEAIIIKRGAITSSSRARKAENKKENNMLLLSALIGLKEKFSPLTVSIYSVAHKDDKSDKLAVYNDKPEKSVISLSLDESTEELKKRLKESFLLEQCPDCDNCIYKRLCNLTPVPVTEAKEIIAPGRKKMEFTPKQLEVITNNSGPMVAIAVAGAGKTASLVEKVCRLIESGVNPGNCLLLAFGNKAAKELKERILARLETSDESKLPNVSTLNSLGYSILRDNAEIIGNEYSLITEIDQKLIIEQVLDEVPVIEGFSYSGMELPFGIVSNIMRIFDEIDRLGEDAFRENHVGDNDGIVTAYKRYKSYMAMYNYISYDEQISLAVEALKTYPSLLNFYRNIYKYVIVDEFQDVDSKQFELVRLISPDNLCVVGDDDQAIYGFRGCSNEYILKFKDYYPKAKVVIMDDNFRSNDKICTACNLLTSSYSNRYEKKLIPHNIAKNMPVFFRNCNKEKIAIIAKKALETYRGKDIAIIARNNKDLVELKPVLQKAGIKARSPKEYLIDSSLFTLFLAFLELKASEEKKDSSFFTFVKILTGKEIFKKREDISLFDEYKEELSDIVHIYYRCVESLLFGEDLYSSVNDVIDILLGGYYSPIKEQILDIIVRKNFGTYYQLYSYMVAMVKFSDQTRADSIEDENCIDMYTAHDSKGKEFKCVIVIDAEKFNAGKNDRDESIRLAFVALSRAKENLIITENSYENSEMYECIKTAVKTVA